MFSTEDLVAQGDAAYMYKLLQNFAPSEDWFKNNTNRIYLAF
jgi:hypothetical protein